MTEMVGPLYPFMDGSHVVLRHVTSVTEIRKPDVVYSYYQIRCGGDVIERSTGNGLDDEQLEKERQSVLNALKGLWE